MFLNPRLTAEFVAGESPAGCLVVGAAAAVAWVAVAVGVVRGSGQNEADLARYGVPVVLAENRADMAG
jgi:hypothetical protein